MAKVKTQKLKMTASDIAKSIHVKHACKLQQGTLEWVVFDEFRTGSHYKYIDVIAVNCWNAHTLSIIAYEIKISRSDFLKDLATFDTKQGETFNNSTEFYYVCPHGLILPDEVPENCGLYWVNASMQLRLKKKAQLRPMDSVPPAMFKSFINRQAKFFLKPKFPVKFLGINITQEEFSEYVAQEIETRRYDLITQEVAAKVIAETSKVKDKYQKAIDFVSLILSGRKDSRYHNVVQTTTMEELTRLGNQLYSMLNSSQYNSLLSKLESNAKEVLKLVATVKNFDRESLNDNDTKD